MTQPYYRALEDPQPVALVRRAFEGLARELAQRRSRCRMELGCERCDGVLELHLNRRRSRPCGLVQLRDAPIGQRLSDFRALECIPSCRDLAPQIGLVFFQSRHELRHSRHLIFGDLDLLAQILERALEPDRLA